MLFQLQEAIFKLYFDDGIYPDVNAVTKIASEVGLNEKNVRSFITDANNHKKVRQTAAENSSLKGISGNDGLNLIYTKQLFYCKFP